MEEFLQRGTSDIAGEFWAAPVASHANAPLHTVVALHVCSKTALTALCPEHELHVVC